MTKKRLVHLGLLFVVIASAVILYAGYRSWCPVRGNFHRVRVGMTASEVGEVLGIEKHEFDNRVVLPIRVWRGVDSQCAVAFDERGRVQRKFLIDIPDDRSC